MGRPLNKKYFGNRNVGTTGTTDDGIGGEGIASVNFADAGSWMATAGGAASPLAGLALPAPTLPGGVQATVAWYYGAEHVTTGAGSVGLVVGDVYTYAGYPGSRIVVATSTNNGTNATFTVTASGSTTTLLTDTQTVSITKVTGTGAASFQVDVFSHIVDAVIGEKGSGYTGAETFTVTTTNGATGNAPAGTIVLTTDSGTFTNGSADANNQENAIKMYANVTGSGSTGALCDIIKQVSGRRYKVTDGTNIGYAELSTDSTPADGYGYIVATSESGATYYVTKLTAHKATLVAKTGDEALDGQAVGWTFDAPSGSIVQIANA